MQKRTPKKKNGRAWLVVLLICVAAIALTLTAAAAFVKLYRPPVDTDIPFDIVTAEKPPKNPEVVGGTTAADAPSDDTEEPLPEFKRDTDSVNFLVMGQDVDSWNTDVVMVVNFNMRTGSLSVMQFPRDTYIETSGTRGRINALLAKCYNEYRASDKTSTKNELIGKSMSSICELLEKSLCIQLDGYIHVNLEGFRNIVDALGGVYIDVPCDMDYEDPEQNLYIHLKAGPQVLTGKQAEGFVRFRSGYVQADIGRVDAQKIFLTALFKQVKNSLTVTTVSRVVEQVFKYVLTDVPLADIVIYAKELLGVDMGSVSMMTLHGSAAQVATGAWYYVINRASALDMVNAYFNVYNATITDAMFDRTFAFTDEDYALFNKVYIAAPDDDVVQVRPDVQTGTSIDDGNLNIYTIK